MLLNLLVICATLPVFSHKIRSSIVVSELTSGNLVSEFIALSKSSPSILIFDLAESNLAALQSYRPNLIFDFSESLLYRQKLKEFAIANNIPFLCPSDSPDTYQQWIFYLHPSPQTEAYAIRSLLQYLEWPSYHIISSETERSRAIASFLSTAPLNSLSNQIDQEVFDFYTAKAIKASGNWKTVVINEEPGASKVFKSLENTRIYKERCGLIVGSKASRGDFKLGTLAIVEEGLEEARSEAEYESKAVLRAISLAEDIASNFNGTVISNDILLKRLEEKTVNGIVSSRYLIKNCKDNWRIIGDIDEENIRTWEEIVYPGNVTEMNNSPPKIPISVNTGALNSDGTLNPTAMALTLGLQPMVGLVNADPSILPNYELEVSEIDCALELFEPDCMEKHLDQVGLAQLWGTNATSLDLNLRLLKENDINIPHISLVFTNSTFDDKNLYPEHLTIFPSVVYMYYVVPSLIKSFGWDQAIFIFLNNADPYYTYSFLKNAEAINLNILNTEEHMHIPYFKTKTYYQEVKHILEFIQQSKCKIIALIVDPFAHLYFLEALYDFGFRRGDLVLIYFSSLASVIDLPEEYFFDRKKVLEVGDGSIIMTVPEYTGKYGEELGKQISSLIYPYPIENTCFMIDSLMIAARSIDLMIRNGKDFEDFEELMSFMRWIQFAGCSGRIAIDSAGNGRRDPVYRIHNFYTTEDTWEEEIVGSYTRGVIIPLKIEKTIIWANGITEVPDDTIYDPKCGIPPELIKDNTESWKISIIITVSLLASLCILFVLIWRCCFYFKRDFLITKREMYLEDGVLLYLPVLETLQFLALGPSFREANFYLAFLCSAAIFEFDQIIDFEKDFWFIISLCLGACGVWCISFSITLSEKEEKLPRIFRDFFDVVGYKCIQVFCQLFFVSLNVLALKIFDCKQGIGDDATDSFLEHDCMTYCWEGTHLLYVIGACAILFVYNLFAMVCRVISDDLMEYVSVNTQPAYAFWKGIFQLTLVALNFHLKDDYETVFGAVYCSLFACWTVFVFRADSTNYERLNGWIKVFTATVLAHEILILGYMTLGLPTLAVILLQVTILVVCIGVGFYVQFARSSSMLYKRKGRNFEKLLKFAYTRRVKAKELTAHELDYVKKPAENIG